MRISELLYEAYEAVRAGEEWAAYESRILTTEQAWEAIEASLLAGWLGENLPPTPDYPPNPEPWREVEREAIKLLEGLIERLKQG
ncbi:MAG: hypothetical protein HQL86_00175 [Magnetococcales bacterium]|nr:hypothetical protein [Magnetococcales bacterium]